MSFSFYNTTYNSNYVDVRNCYQELGEEFCKHYYSLYDNNTRGLYDIFTDKPCITFADEKFGSINDLLNRFQNNRIWGFTHHEIKGNSQPIGNDGLLININGIVSINNEFFKYKFNETLTLCRGDNGNFYINNLVFRFLD